MNFDVYFMLSALQESLKYTWVTLLLAIVPFFFGILFGTVIAIIRFYRVKVLGELLQLFVVIIKGTPGMVMLLIVYFALIQGFDTISQTFHLAVKSKDINLIYIAFAALTLTATAAISETMRGALTAVATGQYEASYSVGLTKRQTLRRIILPQALPVAIPVLCSNLIGLIKGSSLVFMISVTDLMNAALIPANTNYKYLEAYIAAALVYWVLNVVVENIFFWLEQHLSTYKREVLV
ncbi:MAG: tcyM [Firmicutes bacterium]|nr:tcyM [Bacillota bacterium]